MSNVSPSAPIDPKSVDPGNDAAWNQAEADAREAGILWERPKGNTDSAQEMVEKNKVLRDLGNQSGVRTSLEQRVGGKIGEDADATFRALQVLQHVERFDGGGTRLVGGDVDNGRINGFTKGGDAKNGTEAGRLQDFGKFGFSNLKGELQNIQTAATDPEARKQAEALGIEWERPAGNTDSAQDIIDRTPLLKNLGNQSGVRDMLKERVGDFEQDADAAHRAAQVLEHVERYDSNGVRVAGTDVNNGRIDGFTKGGEAKNGTEAGRLQDFGKHGFSNLKGEMRAVGASGNDDAVKAKAADLGILWERPEGDTRSAAEIVEQDPLLRDLGNQSGVKDMLKEQVGDFETDADAAFRATQVLKHIETYDATGHSTGHGSDGRINGFTKSGEAKHGTEAGRLQDFGKFGLDALKGKMTDTVTPEAEAAVQQAAIDAVNKAREDAGLPPIHEQDVTQLETSDKGEDGKALTVTEAAWKKVMDDWKAGIDKGDIKPDDDRAKLYNAMKAGAFLDEGVQMYTLSISEGVTTQAVTGQDLEGVIDGGKVDEQILKLMESEAVGKDLTAARADALSKVEGGDKIVADLKEMAFGADYAKYIQDLSKDPEKTQIATDDIAGTYSSLLAADPEAAAKFAQNMQIDTMTMELDALMADPSKITEENLQMAGSDVGKMLLTLIKKGGLDLGRRAAEAQKFLEGMIGDKKTTKEFVAAMAELGHHYSKTGEVTLKDLDSIIGKGKYEGLQKGGARAFFEEMTKAGFIGSAGGMVSLASGIYQLAGKGGTLADTPEERLAIAKDFVSFVGAGKHFADLGNHIIGEHNKDVAAFNKAIDDKYVASDVAPEPGQPDPRDDETRELKTKAEIDAMKKKPTQSLLGLDKTLDDLLKPPSGIEGPGPHANGGNFVAAVNETLDGATNPDKYKAYLESFDISHDDGVKISKGVEEAYQIRPEIKGPDGKPVSNLQKGASAALLVASAGADTFAGAADIAIGALTIQKGNTSGDDVTVAKGAIQVAAGGFGLAGGMASSLGLVRGLSVVKAVAAPSFFISAILSIATVIPDIINDIKKTKQIDSYRDDLQDFMTQLEDQGLLVENGLDNFRFLDAYMESYGQRDAPDGLSIFDYRDSEVDHFIDYWQGDDGRAAEDRGQFSSGFGLDEDNHEDFSGDGSNLNTDLDRGSTVGS
ncbi:hypothetical protein [Falsirhodobacter halotolerans]|uniref:hypothetical protein n=1 Tax=Falsirhodobacter halotolerans TaxID=1146892 RepID=UPI001FD467BE|nr:hypothetical protein [Falsirhodobacter halotolerans]MCJ8140834.1 hypothetical protein [Falsirhodobacter halotolerans]